MAELPDPQARALIVGVLPDDSEQLAARMVADGVDVLLIDGATPRHGRDLDVAVLERIPAEWEDFTQFLTDPGLAHGDHVAGAALALMSGRRVLVTKHVASARRVRDVLAVLAEPLPLPVQDPR